MPSTALTCRKSFCVISCGSARSFVSGGARRVSATHGKRRCALRTAHRQDSRASEDITHLRGELDVRSVHYVRGVVVGHAQQAVETRVRVVQGDTRLGEGRGREPSRAHTQHQRARDHARTSRVHRVRLQTSTSRTPTALGTARGGEGLQIIFSTSWRESRNRWANASFWFASASISWVAQSHESTYFASSPPVCATIPRTVARARAHVLRECPRLAPRRGCASPRGRR